jgi:uncharacterized protein YjiK
MRFGLLVAAVIIAGGFIFWKDINGLVAHGQQLVQPEKKEKKKDEKKENENPSPGIHIMEKWDLPAELKEVSGIAYMDNDRFACVQDEEGTIFIYNRSSEQIEKKIPFAAPGDYEGITLNGQTAYVVRADGRLFEVDLNGGKSAAKEYKTPLTVEHNVEGLCYDESNNRLLLAIKDEEPGNSNQKGIYAFDLSKKALAEKPVLQIDLEHKVFMNSGAKKNKAIKPSAIGVHPQTKELYITDGPKSRLLIMNASGDIKKLVSLGKEFAQPEGITFSPQGAIFISNEGTDQPGNIIQVKVEE